MNGRSSRMPPEKRKARSLGSPITMSAPCWARMMSSIPALSAVPGATAPSADRSLLSLRGSALTQCHPDRVLERRRRPNANLAMRGDAFRSDGLAEAELRALRQAALGLRGGPEPTGQADLAEAADARPQPGSTGGRGDRHGDAEVGARLTKTSAWPRATPA